MLLKTLEDAVEDTIEDAVENVLMKVKGREGGILSTRLARTVRRISRLVISRI
jgi:hypothetical protein